MHRNLQREENLMSRSSGFPVVLTADRTLMSEYGGGIFLGFSACVPRGLIPDWLYFSFLCPSVETNSDGSVKYAPYGTRKIEAALLNNGFKKEDVIVAHPEHLEKVIGPKTRVVGITENDPLGIGPATSTFTQLFGGEAYMAMKFRELLSHPYIRRYRPKIIVGGPGAWQLEDEEIRRKLGIDCVVIGEGEKVAPALFEKALNDEPLPSIVYGESVEVDEIPVIKNPTIDGIVEIARGCGRGCAFCIPTLRRYRCLPIKHILKEVEVNVKAGRMPLLHAEDVLRYKAKGFEPNRDEVIKLFKSVMEFPGVNSIGVSHFSLSSIVSAPDLLEEISIITGIGKDRGWSGVQTGIETGSPRLIRKLMSGKCKPFSPEAWPQVVIEAFEIMSENSWVPCATVILGLPGETERDIELTIDLVEELRSFKSLIVPLLLISGGGLKNKAESFMLDQMTPTHSDLFLKCWEHNIDWGEKLLQEYFAPKNWGKAAGIKLLFSFGFRQVRRLIQRCRSEYANDLVSMIQDVREGRIQVTPLPVRLLSRITL